MHAARLHSSRITHHPSPIVHRPSPCAAETCIIFDWDDTLLSSSWLAHNGLRLDAPEQVPPEAAALLAVLEESVAALLERALRCGSVVIITNAETGWVELSCRRFLPRCVPVVSRIRVISARSTYETLHPDSPADWKVSHPVTASAPASAPVPASPHSPVLPAACPVRLPCFSGLLVDAAIPCLLPCPDAPL